MSTVVVIASVPAGLSDWIQRTQLDGVDYVFRFLWQQRDTHWWLFLSDQDGSPIASGMKLVAGRDLLATCVDPRRPPGRLAIVDTDTAGGADPAFTDLGERFLLLYDSSR